jgi:hypothetical protein
MTKQCLRLLFVVLCVLVASAVPAAAQTVDPLTSQANKAFQIAANHDGLLTASYRLYIDGAWVVSQDVSALAGGVITFSLGGLPKGVHVFYVEAIGTEQDPETGLFWAVASDALTVTFVAGKPNKPVNLRIVR